MPIKKRNKVSAEFSMSSLTDIIFLLLIFFMLTSSLVTQNAINLKLPSSSSKVVAPKSIAVSIEKGGKFYLDGKRMPWRTVEKSIRNAKRRASDPSSVTVTIYADQDTEWKYITQIYNLAIRLNIKAVAATVPES